MVAGALSILNALSPASVIEYTRPVPAYAEEVKFIETKTETIEEKIARIATEHNISTTTLTNLVECESTFDPKADNGSDRGLLQINRKSWPEVTDEQAFDPDFALNWGAEKIAQGDIHIWTCANCYSYVVTQLGKLPRMADINPNTNIPRVGEIAVFIYNGKKHIAVQDEILTNGFWVKEANYIAGKISRRFVKWDDVALLGFHKLAKSP